ncbi:MAG: MptD family putative ECF transporter S component [Kiritimatiellia bacterium]
MKKFYWDTESLVVVGLFTALAKVVSLLIALLGGGMNPLTLFLKNGVATALLVVMVARVRRFGVLALYVLVGQVVSFLIAGGGMSVLLPGFLVAALLSDALIAACGGYRRIGAVLAGVAAYDLLGRALSLGYSLLHARENMAMVAVAAVFIVLGYLGCLVIGLPCGAKFVKELRHAGIVREV